MSLMLLLYLHLREGITIRSGSYNPSELGQLNENWFD